MSAKQKSIVTLRQNRDGSVFEVTSGGKTRFYEVPNPVLESLDRLSDAEITARAISDPENPPLDNETLERMAIAGHVKAIRLRSSASQAVFAAQYGIPIGTLRDWEYGRRTPDAAALNLLKIIDQEPKAALRALTRFHVPEEAYEYLRNAAELVVVGTLRDLIRQVFKHSAFDSSKLLKLAKTQEEIDPAIRGKLLFNIRSVVDGRNGKANVSHEIADRS